MSAQPRRRTWTALAVSAAVHLSLLALLALLASTSHPLPAPRPLALRLVSLAPSALAARLEGTLEVAGASAPKALRARATRPRALRVEAAPLQEEVAAPRPPQAWAMSAPANALVLAAAQGAGLERGRETEAGGGEGLHAGSGAGLADARLGELHRRLAEAAARCYPAQARRFRLTGEVPLHFCVDATGTATAVSLEGSTGSLLLDRSALECVVPGAEPLSGFEGCFLMSVRFGG